MVNHPLPMGVKKASNSPRHVPAETYQHSCPPPPHRKTVKLISRNIYALEKTTKGYGRTWGIFSDGHSSASNSIWCLEKMACKPEDQSFRTVHDWRIFFPKLELSTMTMPTASMSTQEFFHQHECFGNVSIMSSAVPKKPLSKQSICWA